MSGSFPRGRGTRANEVAMTKTSVLSLATLFLAFSLAMAAREQVSNGSEIVVVHNGPLNLRALVWRPQGRGPFPAVLFNHGSGPQSDPSKASILGPSFARHGYVFLYLYRRGAGLSADQGTNSAELMDRAMAEKGQAGRNDVQLQLLDTELTDVDAGLAFLRARPDVDTSRIAVGGHSFGGQLTLLLAARDPKVRAAVVFGPAAANWEPSPKLRTRLLAAVDSVSVPIFFIHAANDYSVAPGNTLAAEMTRLGKPNRLKIYPAIGQTQTEGHDFVHLGLSTWEPDVFGFLSEHMQRK